MPASVNPTIIELGEFKVNYDESLEDKLAAINDVRCVTWRFREAFAVTDENYPDISKGVSSVRASAVRFSGSLAQGDLEAWCKENKKILARPKEVIDILKASPRPKFDNIMPLAVAGQLRMIRVMSVRPRISEYLSFTASGDEWRELQLGMLETNPREEWPDYYWFLILEVVDGQK